MDMVLAGVTAVALALAIAMGVVVVSMLREERRRSEARVATLLEMAADAEPRPRADVRRADVSRADVADLEIRPGGAVAGVGELFTEPERSSPWASRFAVAAMLATIVGGGGYLILRPSSVPPAAAPQQQAQAAPAPGAPTTLELLALKHTQQADAITISGVVQNPASGVRLSRVAATAFAFGVDGAFLASARAPLDFTTLTPGDESPFVVTIPVTAPVARYRIGFRTEDGEVIAHVDKRQPDTVARRPDL